MIALGQITLSQTISFYSYSNLSSSMECVATLLHKQVHKSSLWFHSQNAMLPPPDQETLSCHFQLWSLFFNSFEKQLESNAIWVKCPDVEASISNEGERALRLSDLQVVCSWGPFVFMLMCDLAF